MYLKGLLVAAGLLAAGSAHAGTVCELRLKPETSWFFLNPTLEKVTVVEATAVDVDRPCPFLAGDELLQINEQVVPGRRAREVMKYWESLSKGMRLDFSIRRDGEVMQLVIN